MSKQIPSQKWDVYATNADCEPEYQGRQLIAHPACIVPDDVLKNFTLLEKEREFVFPRGTEIAYFLMASRGYVLSSVELSPA